MLLFVKQSKIMNLRTILSIPTFLITLSLSIMIVTVIPTKKISQFFNRNQDSLAQTKIYNFLLADRARWREYVGKSAALKLQPKPYAMKELLEIRESFMKGLYNERLRADTSELPEDFKEAWLKYLISERNILQIIYPDSAAKPESINEDLQEMQTFVNEYRNVVNNYGFELNGANLLIDEKN